MGIVAFMHSFLSKKKSNGIHSRCAKDAMTQLRLKYDPYYKVFDKQEGSRVWLEGKEYVMLTSNDYLGLSDHPKVKEAAKAAIDKWGTSTTGARINNGSRSFHEELEEELAAFLGKEGCLVFSAGYLACMASVAGISQRGDLVLVDRYIHSSLWAGILQNGVKVERFSHNSVENFKEVLSFEDVKTPKMVVLEGVYSMEGDTARLDGFMEAAQGQNCFTVVDDAHGFGVHGREGRGTCDKYGVTEDVDIITGSFSKALSSVGGFIAADRDIIEYIKTHSKQGIFSAAIPPSQAAAALASLRVMQEEPEHLQRLWKNTKRYKAILDRLGLSTGKSDTPALPIIFGDKVKVYHFWKALLKEGIFTGIAVAPGVAPGRDLIRSSISARHTEEDFEKIESALTEACKSVL